MSKTVKVRDCMATNLVTLSPTTVILRAVQTLLKHDIAGAPVVDDAGNIVGILSERDCMKVVLHARYHADHGGLVSDYMSPEVDTIPADASIVDAAKLFFGERFHRYPVVEDGDRLVGQISRRDVLRALVTKWK